MVNFLSLLNIDVFVVSSILGMLSLALFEWIKLVRLDVNENQFVKLMDVASMIKEGSKAYLLRQLKVLLVVETIIGMFLAIFVNFHIAAFFAIGAMFSWLCGFIAMYVSVSANYKVALLAARGFKDAFNGAFSVGKLVGYLVKGVALGSVYGAFKYSQYINGNLIHILIGLSFGASLITIFARVGGGIFTKGADIGADLVGKIENNIPEDDERNPAVIADNVGDNVGDCAGMAADLFESYVVIVTSAIGLASYVFGPAVQTYVAMIFTVLASGAFASIFVLLSGWNFKEESMFSSLSIAFKTYLFSSVIVVNAFAFFFWGFENIFAIALCVLIGLFSAAIVMPITEYYTGKFGPVRKIVSASSKGAASNLIQGLAVGLEACFIPFIIIGGSILVCIHLAGVFGVAIACVSMISVCAVILALDAFGPVTDNAGGLAEMGKLDNKVRVVTDKLDAIGNMTKATTKGYAVYSAALATVVLATMYKMDLLNAFSDKAWVIDLTTGNVMAGVFAGAATVALFSSICMVSVNNASMAIIEEVRAQFRAMPGIMEGTQRPLYSRAIDILTKASLKEMIIPALLPILSTVIFFMINKLIFGLEAAFIGLGGFMLGATLVGIFIATSMTISGGAWDNAKKYIEADGEKGSQTHQAAVIGDTVGDPYKDTVGPSINPMIKLIGIIALLLIIMHS